MGIQHILVKTFSILMEYQTFDRFEYKVLSIPNYNPEGFLNSLGKDGWELINFLNNKGIFKRKLDCIITD